MLLLQLTQHIRHGLTPLPFGILLPSVAVSYMLEPLYEIARIDERETIEDNRRLCDRYGKITKVC